MRPAVLALGFAFLGTIVSAEAPDAKALRAHAEAVIAQELAPLETGRSIERIEQGRFLISGDLLKAGFDVAGVVFYEKPDDDAGYRNLQGFALASRRTGSWVLRHFVFFKPYDTRAYDTAPFLIFEDLDRDHVPEIKLTVASGNGGHVFTVFKYRPATDDFICAIDAIGDASWGSDSLVDILDHGRSAIGFEWKGDRLLRRWYWTTDAIPEAIRAVLGDSFWRRRWEEYDDTGNVRYSWESVGDLPHDGIDINSKIKDHYTVYFRIGERRRTIRIQLKNYTNTPSLMTDATLQVSDAVFDRPEHLTPEAEIKTDGGRSFHLSDIADVTILESWPPGVEFPDK